MKKITLLTLLVLSVFGINAQTKILFDATKAQMAGNADWVIDADLHNIGCNTGPCVVGGGNESNPQQIPTPLQSSISASTVETYWQGALSNWGIDCVKKGYVVETLPYNGQITYNNPSNLQDLSNYKVFVIDEPNISFTATEKTAIMNFVKNGGGLCIISDHNISDRNNDGIDSPHALNDLMTNNTVQNNAFGITFDYVNISQTSTVVANLPGNTVLNGSAGNVSQVKWSNGTTMTLNTSNNSSALGLVYTTGSSATGLLNVMCASATYLSGKIVAFGDSSIADDGTGDTGDTLYNGYTLDAAGNHQKLLMNAIVWLATSSPLATTNFEDTKINISIAPNPVKNNELNLNYVASSNEPIAIVIYDTVGRIIKNLKEVNCNVGVNLEKIYIEDLKSGIYFCNVSNGAISKSLSFIVR